MNNIHICELTEMKIDPILRLIYSNLLKGLSDVLSQWGQPFEKVGID